VPRSNPITTSHSESPLRLLTLATLVIAMADRDEAARTHAVARVEDRYGSTC
jgi:hypothetical protein